MATYRIEELEPFDLVFDEGKMFRATHYTQELHMKLVKHEAEINDTLIEKNARNTDEDETVAETEINLRPSEDVIEINQLVFESCAKQLKLIFLPCKITDKEGKNKELPGIDDKTINFLGFHRVKDLLLKVKDHYQNIDKKKPKSKKRSR